MPSPAIDEARVYVVQRTGRKYLLLRAKLRDGSFRERSSGTTRKRDAERAAAKWEQEAETA